MIKPRVLYTLGLWLLLPYILFHLLWRSRKQPEYLNHIPERFGFYRCRSDKPIIWLHAVSVGETRATQSLVAKLLETFPEHDILITHTTPTGRATGEQLYGDRVLRAYLPYDYPFAVTRFLCHFRPRLGLLMETEIWFNLIHACRSTDVPLLLLNARMSEKSARGYGRFARLTGEALGSLAAVAAQTEEDAGRLARLGAKNLSVMGNLKFDIEPPAAMLELGKRLREQFGAERKVLLAASTREGEEELLLDALPQIQVPGLLLVIVPRHPQRFGDVAALIEKRGLSFQRRSEDQPVSSDTQVVLGDSMGEMFGYYASSDLAFIGGSLLPYGGQNLIEACAVGTPVIVGPHMYNFSEAARSAVETGGSIQVADATGLAATAQRLLDDPATLHELGQRCRLFVAHHQGATGNALVLVASHIDLATGQPFARND
ncbi:MAG TPA: lipid IV(A) 3-deoxy-D-manno-octulosonic acid transferase [Gallionella sp.]|nr:lipid IV(A) 3-deoxy-D-manno-octulosonic acid transferase [Gallionella sp.]